MILTTKGIDDLCLKEFVEAGAMAVRRCKKEDLRRIAKATGATLVSSLANLEGEETFEAGYLGSAEEVVQERISDDELILVKGTKVVSSSSVILRGANGEMHSSLAAQLALIGCVWQTFCWTKWSGLCTTRFASSSARWRVAALCQVAVPSKLHSASTSKISPRHW